MEFSEAGSNVRELEEEVAMYWVMLLSEIEEATGELVVTDVDAPNCSIHITLADILIFVTGSSDVPPMGFSPKPVIMFSSGTAFPISSTCSNTLTLPLGLCYEQFKYNIAFGIQNSPGFQRI